MLRVCFGRKNRTLRAGWLGTRKVLEWVEGCWRGWCALNDVPVDEDGGGGEGGVIEVEEAGGDGVGVEEEDPEEIMNVDDAGGDGDEDLPDFFTPERDEVNGASGSKRKKKGKVSELVREKVRKVLEDDTDLADRRARTLDQNDFLRLLLCFNNEGIHFN